MACLKPWLGALRACLLSSRLLLVPAPPWLAEAAEWGDAIAKWGARARVYMAVHNRSVYTCVISQALSQPPPHPG